MRSLQRRLSRGRAKIVKSDLLKGNDGQDLKQVFRKSNRGRWILEANLN
jgi:hypothetical protein